MLLEALFVVLIVASWVYWLLAWWWTRRFFAQVETRPEFTPPVSLLKPLRGVDPQAYENFASFCDQDYPHFELLFGVADPSDPVVSVVQRLQREFPQLSIRLVVAPPLGANRKVSTLHYLVDQAHHDLLVISDSDIRVRSDYIRRVVAPLVDTNIGLVTCPYRGESPQTLTARLEALHMTATFLPSVVVARRFLAMRFAMGSTVALRRADLEQIGGFVALTDYLADDFQLAVRIADLGRRVVLSQYVVASVLGATTFREQWQREVRWSRTNRANRPSEYPGMLLTFSTPLAVILALLSGLDPVGWEALTVSLMLRWLVTWAITGYVGGQETRKWIAWLPIRDMLSMVIWCTGGVGRRIVWRGEEYIVSPGGRMQALAGLPGPLEEGQVGE